MKIAILIPTYNESKNLEPLLSDIKKTLIDETDVRVDVYIIDDSSPDGTAELATDLGMRIGTSSFSITPIIRKRKEGLGRAYIYGFQHILNLPHPPEFILQMDADQSHNPMYLRDFLHCARESADFIVGSRYIPGGGTLGWSWYRKLLSRGGNQFARSILGTGITDYTGGYNMYATDLIRRLDFESLNSAGYGFLIDLKFRALQASAITRQVPIIFVDRIHGKSKMPASTIFQNFLPVLKIRRAWKKQ